MVPNWLKYFLIELTRDRTKPADHYHHIADDCFVSIWNDGHCVLRLQGRNYVPQQLGWRGRLHNWLVRT